MSQHPAGLAAELDQLAAERHGDPVRGLARVSQLRDKVADDVETMARLVFLNGLFLKELLRPQEAKTQFEHAVSLAMVNGFPDTEARARANLGLLLTDLGKTSEADAEMERAQAIAPDSARGLVMYLTALVMQRRGDHHEALATYAEALPLLEEVGDQATIEMLGLNRAIGRIYLDDIDGARAVLTLTEESAGRFGLETFAAMAAQNLGFLNGRRGYLADALAAFDRAETRYQGLSWRPKQAVVMYSDRAEVLLQAGLSADAKIAAGRAVRELEADGILTELAEARLLLARSCIALGHYDEAKREALTAAREFRRVRRPAWVAQASYVGRQVDYLIGRDHPKHDRRLSERLEYVAAKLSRQGWPVEARDALVFGALAALDGAETDRADSLLRRATRLRADGAVQHRARLHLARAKLLRDSGRPDRAAAMFRRGVRRSLDVLTTSGSAEARVEGLRFAGELASLGTEMALHSGQPVAVLRAIELQRSTARALTPSGAIGDEGDLGRLLDDLRKDGPASDAEIENRVREQSLRAKAEPTTLAQPLSWARFRAATADLNFVYYLEVEKQIWAVVVRGATTRLVELTSTETVAEAATFLRFSVDRLGAVGATNPRALAGMHREIDRLRSLLLDPLDLRHGPLVVVPSPALADTFWGLLSSPTHEISVAASGTDWLDAHSRVEPRFERVVLVSGPRLEASDREVAEIKKLYPGATVLTGKDATVRNVLESFAEADLIHIAAHGLFRAESPMFSRLELYDGPLTVYDLQRVSRMPRLVVLPACESGAKRTYESGGTLGTASALVALGSRSVVAPIEPVADSASCDHMVSFHRHLLEGTSPTGALLLATGEAYEKNDAERIATAGMFVVNGAA